MDYIIKRGATTIATVSPTGWQTRQAMGVNMVEMEFTLQTPVAFEKGDWCTVFGEKYILINSVPFVKVNQKRYDYSLKLVHEFYTLQDIRYKGLDSSNNMTVMRFSLMGDAAAHMNLLIDNANRVQSGWTVGVVDTTIAKNISYDGENLLQVLNRLASEFETEYWIENKTIHLAKRTGTSGLELSYGKGNGLLNLTKGSKDDAATIFTRLFVEGGSQNLPIGYRSGAKSLLMPSGTDYIEDATLVSKYGVIEGFAAFDDIFPQRVGTISGVGADEFTFTDSGIDFDVNSYLLPNITAKLIFQTGLLAGYQFEVSSYTHATKTFVVNEINEPATTTGVLPTSTLKPAVGDKYILVDIQMPTSYVTAAESALQSAAEDYFDKGSSLGYNDKYSGDCDPIYFKSNAIDLSTKLGFTANIVETNPAINVDVRMSTIKRDIQNAWKYEIDFTDKIELSNIARSYADSKRTRQIIAGVSTTGGSSGADGGSSYFLSQLSGDDGYLYISGAKAKAGQADTATDATHAYNADLATLATIARNVQSSDFVSGMDGEGHRLLNGDLELNNINVRGTLAAYEFLVKKVKSVGGSFVVSGGAKVKSVVSHSGTTWTLQVEDDLGVEFEQYDVVICQNFNGTNQKYYKAVVTGTTSDTFTIDILSGAGTPAIGDDVVQIDNTSDADRKGMLYLTNSDSGSPFLDVVYGYHTDFSNRVKVRLGRLDGITDADFGALTGWGLYGGNVYLNNAKVKGVITVQAGSNVYNKTEVDSQLLAIDNELDNYANDDKLTPTEKLSIKLLYDAAANEKEDYKTQGTALGLSVTDYNSAYNALAAYVSPLLTDMTTTSDIDGATLRSKFYNYGVEKSLLIKAIQAKQKELTDRKSKNFTATPTNYQAGDTWTLQTDTIVNGVQYKQGDLLTASAASASYNQAHWTKQVRYTDDSDLTVGGENLLWGMRQSSYAISSGCVDSLNHVCTPIINVVSGRQYLLTTKSATNIKVRILKLSDDNVYDSGQFSNISVGNPLLFTPAAGVGKVLINFSHPSETDAFSLSYFASTQTMFVEGNREQAYKPPLKDVIDAAASYAPVRYFRFSGSGRSGDRLFYPAEIKLISNGINVLDGTKIFTPSSGVINKSLLIDGNSGVYVGISVPVDGYGNPTAAASLTIDLNSLYAIERVEYFNFGATTPTKWEDNKIEASQDGITWHTLWENSSMYWSEGGLTIHGLKSDATLPNVINKIDAIPQSLLDLPPIRYIKWWQGPNITSGDNNSYFAELMAIRSDESNAAIGKTVTSSWGGSATQIIDGDTGSYIGGTRGLLDHVTLDLGSIFTDIVELRIYGYYAGSYKHDRVKVDISHNGTTWFTIFDTDVTGQYVETSAGKTILVPNAMTLRIEGLELGIDDLEDYVDNAFKDGVIEEAEAKAIEKYINVVNETYEQLTQQYSVVYADPLLTGTPKTDLATAKSNLDTAKGNLISSINTAIADGKTTGAEKSDVDSKYATFKTRIGEYTTAVENAYKSITDAINAIANSKAKLFTIDPPSGYNVGDLWIPQSNYSDTGTAFKKDNLYRATTASASFSKSHWVLATNYTDDTVANTKTTTFTGATAPTPYKTGDTWFDTTNKKWKTWNGSTWDVREDKVVGYIKDALDASTEIVGGLTLGTVMAVKSGGVVKAYMSAASGSDYAFAAGVSNFADVGETRAFAVKHNGDIEVKYGGSDRLKFVASTGVLTITGTINASAGTIGGFTIESNKLKSNTPAWETEALVLNKANNTFEFYSGYQTDDGTQYGNIIPDIKIQSEQGFKDIINANPVGVIYCGGLYASPSRYSSVVGGNGIWSNSSNTKFKPNKGEAGNDSNASIVGRIKISADKAGDSIYSFYDRRISAAIAGVTDLTQGSNDSRTYGGYFNSIFAGTIHTGVKVVNDSNTHYFSGEFITTIYCISGASGAWLMFPEINHEEGRVIIIRNSSGGTVNISRSSSESLSLGDNSTVTTTSVANKETQVWQRLSNQWRQIIKQTF